MSANNDPKKDLEQLQEDTTSPDPASPPENTPSPVSETAPASPPKTPEESQPSPTEEPVAEHLEEAVPEEPEASADNGGSDEPPTPPDTPSAEKEPAKKGKGFLVLIFLLVVGLVVGGIFFFRKPKDSREEVAILAETAEDFSQSGSVTLSGLGAYSEEEIQKNLEFTPSVPFQVSKQTDNTVTVTLTDPRNISYAGTFSYVNKEGEQTKEAFKVNGPLLTVRLASPQITVDDAVYLYFNEPVDLKSLQTHLETSGGIPELSFVDAEKKMVALNSATGWRASSPLIVRINNEYTSQNGKQFVNNQSLSVELGVFDYDEDGAQVFAPLDTVSQVQFLNSDNFILSQDVNMMLHFSGDYLEQPVPIKVEMVQLGNVEKFKSQSDIYLDYDLELEGLVPVKTYNFEIQNGSNQFEIENPGNGAYSLSMTYLDPIEEQELEVRTGYLVTPYSIYLQASSTETVAWLHNSETGRPAAGYTVSFDDGREEKTDEDGIAVIDHLVPENTDSNSGYQYNPYANYEQYKNSQVSVRNPNGELVYYDLTSLRKDKNLYTDYYHSSFYLDRGIYQPEDVISFWGFVKPHRINPKELPTSATIIFDEGGLDLRVEAEINQHGVYHGELPIEGIRSSGYSIRSVLVYETEEDKDPVEAEIGFEYVTVEEYQKPAYVIESSTDKTYYEPEDEVEVTVTPTFYDGSPLPEYTLEVFYWNERTYDWIPLEDITTDLSGEASFQFPARPESVETYGNYLHENSYRVQIASDGESINHYGSYYYLPTRYISEAVFSPPIKGGDNSLDLTLYEVDFNTSAFKEKMEEILAQEHWYPQLSGKEILSTANKKVASENTSFDLEIRWRYSTVGGEIVDNRYDNNVQTYIPFKNNFSLDLQDLPANVVTSWKTKAKSITVETDGGKASIKDVVGIGEPLDIDPSKKLNVRMYYNYTDPLGTNNRSYVYYPDSSESMNWYSYQNDQGMKGLSFLLTDKETGEDLTPESGYYRRATVDVNKPITFQLALDGEAIGKDQGTILFTTIQGGLLDYRLVEGTEFEFEFPVEYGRNISVVASYFDGIRSHYITDLEIMSSEESMSLDLEVTPDKESYNPGDTVTLNIKATDYMGNGVPGNLLVSVVDESIFALEEQYISLLSDLHNQVYYMDNYVTKYCTTYRSGGANIELWSGGKDGDGFEMYSSQRENFKDTAYFFPTRTDENGVATVTFELPDNITSWRITTLEVGDDLRAGNATHNIISTLPFFARPVLTSKYIDGDEISILLQGHGVLVEEDSEMKYTATITGDGVNETLTATGTAYQPWEFNFGVLPEGEYELSATAELNGYSDTVLLPIYVIKNNLELVVHKPLDIQLGETLDVNALRYPVSLSIYDEEHEGYFATITSLLGHYCSLPSQRISRYVAKNIIRDSIEDGVVPVYLGEEEEYIADLQTSSGGISTGYGAESDLTLSMYVTLVSKEAFNQNALASYFAENLENSSKPEEHAQIYLAQAALGTVDVKTVETFFEGKKDTLPLQSKAYTIAALAYLGETDKASALYDEHLASHLDDLADRNYGGYQFYTYENVLWERDTAAIWVAASLLNETDADNISLHFANYSWRYRTLFEGMIYVTNYNRPVKQKSVSYDYRGENRDVPLNLNGLHTLVLSKSDLEEFKFTHMDDDIRVVAYYIGEPEEMGLETSEYFTIDKELKDLGKNTYEVTVTLTFEKDAPLGVYNISDWIPSNSRLYRPAERPNFYMNTEGQKIYLDYWRELQREETVTFVYQIRQTYRSEAMLDSTYVIHGETGENASTERLPFQPESGEFLLPMVHLDPEKSVDPVPKDTETGEETAAETTGETETSEDTTETPTSN